MTFRTLNPAKHRIVLTGTNTAIGVIGRINANTYTAAVYGPSTGQFTVINAGLIQDAAAGNYAAGLLIASPGTITNRGYIEAAGGPAILETSYAAGAKVTNSGNVFSSGRAGVQLNGYGAVRNTGLIGATQDAILLESGGYVSNAGVLEATTIGIGSYGNAAVNNTGVINAGYYGLLINAGTITNAGTIDAIEKYAVSLASGYITNTGLLKGIGGVASAGQFSLTNAQTGTITALSGVAVVGLSGGYVDNQGLITAAFDTAIGLRDGAQTIINAGTLSAQGNGIYAAQGTAYITNSGYVSAASNAIIDGSGGTINNTGIILGLNGITGNPHLAQPDIYNTGYIKGQNIGITLSTAVNVVNQGTIIGADKTGAALYGGGSLANYGVISGFVDGVFALGAPATMVNRGVISATFNGNSTGANVLDGGTIINYGSISGQGVAVQIAAGTSAYLYNGGALLGASENAVYIKNPSASVNNTGIITGGLFGIKLAQGGQITNSGAIYGATGGISAPLPASSPNTINNSGNITGGHGDGIQLNGAATLTNTGQIYGTTGIQDYGTAQIQNQGVIAATIGAGIAIAAGAITNTGVITSNSADGIDVGIGPATITNSGTIAGAYYGILAAAGATLTNIGTIIGGAYAIQFNAYYANRLIINAASVIKGGIDGGAGVLELAAGGGIGTFSTAEKNQFADFNSLQIDAGATWDLAGNFTLTSPSLITNNGTIKESAADTLTLNQGLFGTGVIDLGKHGLTTNAAIGNHETIVFTGTHEALTYNAGQFKAQINGFALGDTIDLGAVTLGAVTATHFINSVLTITEAGTNLLFTFANPSTFAHNTFALSAAGHGTAITLSAPAALLPVTQVTTLAPLTTLAG